MESKSEHNLCSCALEGPQHQHQQQQQLKRTTSFATRLSSFELETADICGRRQQRHVSGTERSVSAANSAAEDDEGISSSLVSTSPDSHSIETAHTPSSIHLSTKAEAGHMSITVSDINDASGSAANSSKTTPNNNNSNSNSNSKNGALFVFDMPTWPSLARAPCRSSCHSSSSLSNHHEPASCGDDPLTTVANSNANDDDDDDCELVTATSLPTPTSTAASTTSDQHQPQAQSHACCPAAEYDEEEASRRDTITIGKLADSLEASTLHAFRRRSNKRPQPSSSSSLLMMKTSASEPRSLCTSGDQIDIIDNANDQGETEDDDDDHDGGDEDDDDDLKSHRCVRLPKRADSQLSHSNVSASSQAACEVVSLSSLTSSYSQFDFTSASAAAAAAAGSAVLTTSTSTSTSTPASLADAAANATSSGNNKPSFLGSILFKKHSLPTSSALTSSGKPLPTPSSKLDIFASRFFSLKQQQQHQSPSPASEAKSSGSEANNTSDAVDGPQPPPPPSSSSCRVSGEVQLPSSVLIFENRPSNLPAKSQQEAAKHRLEYEKMVEIAKKREKQEKVNKLKKQEQQMRKEDFMANSLHVWNNEILPKWNEMKDAKRTHQLWWHGLPPSVRGKVWRLALGNGANLNRASYVFYEKRARDKLALMEKCGGSLLDSSSCSASLSSSPTASSSSSSVELIRLDVSRTFPQLCFFQKDGPYHEALHSVLGAYACYKPQIGYVQGMSCLAAILLLNMEASEAFVCLANMLDMAYLNACFRMDHAKMNKYFRVHQVLFEYNLPRLYAHFERERVKPDLYLIEWVFTLFSKSLPLDVMSRVWDVFLRDKDPFLFRVALGILDLYKDTLVHMEFIQIVTFLIKLPESINATQLFRSIERISLDIDHVHYTFQHLINEIVN